MADSDAESQRAIVAQKLKDLFCLVTLSVALLQRLTWTDVLLSGFLLNAVLSFSPDFKCESTRINLTSLHDLVTPYIQPVIVV